MKSIDLYLDNAILYNVQDRVVILLGEEATVVVNDFTNEQVFSNNDKVLDIDQVAGSVAFKASAIGSSTLLFMAGDLIAKKLLVEVVDAIALPATTLGVSFDEPVMK